MINDVAGIPGPPDNYSWEEKQEYWEKKLEEGWENAKKIRKAIRDANSPRFEISQHVPS